MTYVLLVEPDKLLGDTYKKALKRNGLKVELVSSAQSAIHFLDSHTPMVIVLEIQLAKHNGVEFLYELRSHQDWRDIPVIVNSMVPDNILGLTDGVQKQLGIDKVLYKPKTTLTELLELIDSYKNEDSDNAGTK